MQALLWVTIVLMQFEATSFASDWKSTYQKVKPGIPIILSSGAVCSGIAVESPSPKALIATAAHCVSKLREVFVLWPEPEPTIEKAKLLTLDRKNDIAILEVSFLPKGVKPAVVADSQFVLLPGEEIATIGHPGIPLFVKWSDDGAGTYLLSTGVLSQSSTNWVLTDVSVSPGNSGGPLFLKNGDVIGIVSKKLAGGASGNVGLASAVEPLKANIEIAKKRSPLSNSQVRAPSIKWTKANTSFFLNIGISYGFGIDKKSELSKTLFSYGLDIYAWDRLALGFFGGTADTIELNSLLLGWTMHLGSSPYLNSYWVPAFEYSWLIRKIDSENKRARSPGFSLAFHPAQFFMRLKFSGFRAYGESIGLISLSLPFGF